MKGRLPATNAIRLWNPTASPSSTNGRLAPSGLKQGWFESTIPNYYTLRNIAERTIEAYEKGPDAQQQRLKMALLGGLVVFALGVYFYVQSSGMESPPWIMIALVAGVIIVTFMAFLMKK